MAHPLRFSRRAESDLRSMFQFIAEERPESARRVVGAIERAV